MGRANITGKMTTETKEKLTTEFIKGGVGIIVMAVVIYFLYKDNSLKDKDIRAEITILRKETKECSKAYQDVLLNQIEKNTKVMHSIKEFIIHGKK